MTEIARLSDLVARILAHVDGGGGSEFAEPIQRGSAAGSVSVLDDPDEEGGLLLRVRLRIMRLPPERQSAFYRRLLELNHDFQGRAAFSVGADEVVTLTSGHPVDTLDPSEIIEMVLWTAEKADDYDDILLTEFGYEHSL